MLGIFQKNCLHTPYGGQQLLTQGLSEYFFKDADKIRSPQMQTSKVQMTKTRVSESFPPSSDAKNFWNALLMPVVPRGE